MQVMVSASQDRVPAPSRQPPHRSTTGSPSTTTATQAPTSSPQAGSPSSMLRRNAASTAANFGSQVPETDIRSPNSAPYRAAPRKIGKASGRGQVGSYG